MADTEGKRRGETRWPRPSMPTLPRIPVPLAAGVTGLLCGVLATVLVWSGEQGCDAVRGRPSCGGYGLVMLLVILAACFALGVSLLRAFGVDDPGVTTFFGLALPMLVVLGLLLDYVFDRWMAFALPVLVAVCFVLSTYLARALAAANPTVDAEDAEDADDRAVDGSRTVRSGDDDTVAQSESQENLPRYAPSDDS